MRLASGIQALENAGLTEASSPGKGPGRLISLIGPSGSGKTTLAQAMASSLQVYCEHHEQNPEMAKLMAGEPGFDAFTSQKWFLDQIGKFIKASSGAVTILLDQDPIAITHVYGRLFYDRGVMRAVNYRKLLSLGLSLQRRISRSRKRTLLSLTAPAEILRRRVSDRSLISASEFGWYDVLEKRFAELTSQLPVTATIETAELTVAEATERVVRAAKLS